MKIASTVVFTLNLIKLEDERKSPPGFPFPATLLNEAKIQKGTFFK